MVSILERELVAGQILPGLKEMYEISPEKLWELRNFLRWEAEDGHPYFSRWSADQLPDVEEALKTRGLLIEGECNVVPPKQIQTPRGK